MHNLFPWFLAHQKDNKFREGTRQTDFQVSWSLQQPRFQNFQTYMQPTSCSLAQEKTEQTTFNL